jgi:hypothetical protein
MKEILPVMSPLFQTKPIIQKLCIIINIPYNQLILFNLILKLHLKHIFVRDIYLYKLLV